MIAQKIGQETLLPSLQLAVEDPELQLEQLRRGLQLLVHELDLVDRSADAGPTRRVPRTSPLPMELNPQVVFERLFGSGSTPELRAQRMKQSQSILDSLVAGAGEPAQAAWARPTSGR